MSMVTLDELAAQLRIEGNPAEYVTERGYKLEVDWAGRAAVTSEDAAALVAEHSTTPTWGDTTWKEPS